MAIIKTIKRFLSKTKPIGRRTTTKKPVVPVTKKAEPVKSEPVKRTSSGPALKVKIQTAEGKRRSLLAAKKK